MGFIYAKPLKMYMKFSVVASPPPAATPQRATSNGAFGVYVFFGWGPGLPAPDAKVGDGMAGHRCE